MGYKVQIEVLSGDRFRKARDATIVGLKESAEFHELMVRCQCYGPNEKRHDVRVQFGHSVYTTTMEHPYENVAPYHKFYGGMGEGRSFDRWQDALLASLYDEFQTHDALKDGDDFEVTYLSESALFRCAGVHVIPV